MTLKDIIEISTKKKGIFGRIYLAEGQYYFALPDGRLSPIPYDIIAKLIADSVPINISELINDVGYLTTVAVDGTTITGDGTLGNPLVAAGTVTPSALTKVNDTNVTLTLGGTPATSLLQAVSLTLGWTGTLADARITSATNWNTAYTNRITSLTTTGTSGAATLIANTLNIPQYQAAGSYVTSVSGTANRISSTGGTTPVIDIDAAYVGQTSITTVGTITTGTWNGTDVAVTAGGTGSSTELGARTNLGVNTKIDTLALLGSSIKGQTFDSTILKISANVALTDNRTIFILLDPIPAGLTLTGVLWYQGAQGSYTADNNNKIALYSYSAGTLTLERACADDGNLWKGTANSYQTKAFTSTYMTVANTAYFVAALYNNSAQVTAPTIGHCASMVANATASADFTNSAKISGAILGQNDLTTPQAMSGITGLGTVPFFAVY